MQLVSSTIQVHPGVDYSTYNGVVYIHTSKRIRAKLASFNLHLYEVLFRSFLAGYDRFNIQKTDFTHCGLGHPSVCLEINLKLSFDLYYIAEYPK